ncbi:MAG: hypothetical protein J7K64_08730 [Bacteroidales bacterium]|nr:hypothetical protein [Bacteroidales bacterium]
MKYRVLIFIFIAFGLNINAQNKIVDSTQFKRNFYTSTNVRPVNIEKGNYLFSAQATFKKYYKAFNPQSGSVEKLSDKVVLNDAALNLTAIYGIGNKINLIAFLPIKDFHHYSPMNFSKGIGTGDITIGGNYNLLNNSANAVSLRLDFGFPTGKSANLSMQDISLGTGAFTSRLTAEGLHSFKKTDFIYAAYYEYRTPNSSGINIADETGIYAFFQNNFTTEYGNFGFEYGLIGNIQIPAADISGNITAQLFIGANYAYNENINIRLSVPYTVFQQNAFLTDYTALLQFDYLLNKNKKQ